MSQIPKLKRRIKELKSIISKTLGNWKFIVTNEEYQKIPLDTELYILVEIDPLVDCDNEKTQPFVLTAKLEKSTNPEYSWCAKDPQNGSEFYLHQQFNVIAYKSLKIIKEKKTIVTQTMTIEEAMVEYQHVACVSTTGSLFKWTEFKGYEHQKLLSKDEIVIAELIKDGPEYRWHVNFETAGDEFTTNYSFAIYDAKRRVEKLIVSYNKRKKNEKPS
jgi:hypothetical protein